MIARRTQALALRRAATVVVLAVVVVVALGALGACGGKPSAVPGTSSAERPMNDQGAPAAQALIGHLVATIGERTIGPFMARRPDGKAGLLAWVTASEGSARSILAVPLTGGGEPRGPAKTIAHVGVDTTMLVVRNVGGRNGGFAVTWTVLTDRGEALWAIVLGEDGLPRAKAIELARTSDDVVWVDVVPTESGAICVWAEETRGQDANVLAASLDPDGKVRGVPTRLARGVAGWHALEIPGGVGVSTIVAPRAAPSAKAAAKLTPGGPAAAPPGPSAPESRGGALSFKRLDIDGHPTAPPTLVVATPTVTGDVEVVRAAGRLVFAWTDRTAEEPSIAAAGLTDEGVVEPVRVVVEARGGAALLGLAAGPAGAALMWESPVRPTNDVRRVHSARMGTHLGLQGRASTLEVIGRGMPEIVATATGFAILATLRDCEPGAPRCVDAPVMPAVVRTDGNLVPVQREAFGFGTDPASMAWGMSCEKDGCVALAASGALPSRIRAAELRARVNQKPPPDVLLASRRGPRVTDVAAVANGESIVDLAAAPIGEGTVLATLSTPVAPSGSKPRGDDARSAPLLLSARFIDGAGVVAPPVVLTNRALAVGGVAVAPAGKPEDGGAVVWVARDNGDPEVHVTRIDKRGKKTSDMQLTTVKGDASDVAIAWGGSSWIVAWIDGRDGNGEVYATKIGLDLARGNGERITNAPGDASDLVALVRGDLVWLAWADPRESPRDGMSDIFVSAVRAKDAKRAVDEQRLLSTAAHSRTPQLAPSGEGGVHVAWIEEAPMGASSPNTSGYGAMWASVDASGKVARKPVKLPLGGDGAASSVAIAAEGEVMRAVVARSSLDAISLDAIDLAATVPQAFPLLTLDGPPSLDVALVMEGGALFFNDEGPAPADKRARRASITWLAP